MDWDIWVDSHLVCLPGRRAQALLPLHAVDGQIQMSQVEFHVRGKWRRRAVLVLDRAVGGLYRLTKRPNSVGSTHMDIKSLRPDTILVISLDYIGDAIMATPVYGALKRAYPDAHLVALVRPWAEDVLQNSPHIDELLVQSPPWWVVSLGQDGLVKWLGENLRFLFEYVRTIRAVRAKGFDLAVDLRGDFRHILLYAWLGRCRYRIGYARTGGSYLLSQSLRFDPRLHAVDSNLRLLELLGIRDPDSRLKVWTQDDQESRVRQLLAEEGVLPEERLAVVHPGSRGVTKRWSADRFAELVDWLARDHGVKTILVGGPDEKHLCDSIAAEAMHGHAVVMAGCISLAELAVILRRAMLFVGSDSGPQHVAAAMGTAMVVLFGPTDPQVYGPRSTRAEVIWNRFPCAPCVERTCRVSHHGGSACMESITAESVTDAVCRVAGLVPPGPGVRCTPLPTERAADVCTS